MSYTVTADEQLRLVEVVYSGPITTSTRICAMEDGATLLDAHRFARVLVDLRAAVPAPEPQSPVDAFAKRIVHRPRLRDSRLAYLAAPEVPANVFIQTMATARHVAVAYFDQREAALHWLMQET